MRNRPLAFMLCLLALCGTQASSFAADWGNLPPKAGSSTVVMPQEQRGEQGEGQGGILLREGQAEDVVILPETPASPQGTPQHAARPDAPEKAVPAQQDTTTPVLPAQPENTQTRVTPPSTAVTPDKPAAEERLRLWQMLPLSDVPPAQEQAEQAAPPKPVTPPKKDKPAAPKEPKKERPPVKPEKANGELVIPKNPKDISFMEGRWRCETGLFSSSTNEPVVMEFQFDKKGRGTGTVFEKNTRCRGKARASLAPEGMRILLDPQICGNGSSYTADEIQCRNKNNTAHCDGKNQAGTWKAKFFRITR